MSQKWIGRNREVNREGECIDAFNVGSLPRRAWCTKKFVDVHGLELENGIRARRSRRVQKLKCWRGQLTSCPLTMEEMQDCVCLTLSRPCFSVGLTLASVLVLSCSRE